MDNNIEYITQSTIIEDYGFTKGMIDKLLPEPMLKHNPRCRYAPYKLWPRTVVEGIMKTEDYAIAKEKAERRREGAYKAVTTKKEKIRKNFEPALSSIKVRVLPEKVLVDRTLQSKQNYEDNKAREKGYFNESSAWDAPQETINRWVVNYIRHNLTTYDYYWGYLGEGIGRKDVAAYYKRAVLEKIAEVYPTYKDECERQILETY